MAFGSWFKKLKEGNNQKPQPKPYNGPLHDIGLLENVVGSYQPNNDQIRQKLTKFSQNNY